MNTAKNTKKRIFTCFIDMSIFNTAICINALCSARSDITSGD